METLYSKINKQNKIKKETKDIEKIISKYLNQKHIKKLLINGLKTDTDISIQIDDKKIELYIKKDYNNPFNTYKHYIFHVFDTKKDTVYIDIQPSIITRHLNIRLYYIQNDITSEQIINYLKTTIGIE
jgi:hypothetical protein